QGNLPRFVAPQGDHFPPIAIPPRSDGVNTSLATDRWYRRSIAPEKSDSPPRLSKGMIGKGPGSYASPARGTPPSIGLYRWEVRVREDCGASYGEESSRVRSRGITSLREPFVNR